VQPAWDMLESLRDYLLEAPWEKGVVLKTFRSIIHVASLAI